MSRTGYAHLPLHGGHAPPCSKDGTPFPVDRAAYDQTIDVMHRALNRAKVDRTEKVKAFRRLAQFGSGQ